MAQPATLTSSAATGPAPVPMRASDADRMASVLVLQDAIARGLLTTGEGEERISAAFAATHRHQLAPLTLDLPPAEDTQVAWQSTGWFSAVGRVLLELWLVLAGALARLPRRTRITGVVILGLLVVAVVGLGIAEPFHGGPGGEGPAATGLPHLRG